MPTDIPSGQVYHNASHFKITEIYHLDSCIIMLAKITEVYHLDRCIIMLATSRLLIY